MKIKTILIISLAVNLVLIGTLGYIHTLEINPATVPPVILLVNKSNPESVAVALKAATGKE